MKIIGISLPDQMTLAQFNTLMSWVSETRQERTRRFLKKEDQYRSLIGEVVLRYEQGKNITIVTDDFGKPSLANNTNVHFNISHSGNWVVVAIHDQPIGVDVEEIRPLQFSDYYSFFHADEVEWLKAQPEETRTADFFTLWTLKESYIKAVGKGLSIALDRFSVVPKDGTIVYHDNEEIQHHLHFGMEALDDAHKLAYCVLGDSCEVTMEQYTFQEFFEKLTHG